MVYLTAADVFRPKQKTAGLMYNIALVLIGSILIWLSAKVQINLSFSPAPITAQTLVILLLAMLYGSKLGAATVFAYLVQGGMGLPVFAKGGGIWYFFTASGGYLIGFLVAAYVVGRLAESGWDRNFFKAILAMLTGNVIIYAIGCLGAFYLLNAIGTAVGLPAELTTTVFPEGQLIGSISQTTAKLSAAFTGTELWEWFVQPFLIGDVLKTVLAAILLPVGWSILGKDKSYSK